MSFYQLILCLFVSVLVFALLQLANAQHSKYLLDFTFVTNYYDFFLLENPMRQVILDTNFGHLINLKLKFKWVSEKGIENILLSPIFIIYLFIYIFIDFFNWAKLTATRVKLLLTDKFIFVKN